MRYSQVVEVSGCTGPDRPGLAAARRRAYIRCTGKIRGLHWQESLRPGAALARVRRWGPVPLFGRCWRARPGPARCARRPVPILARRAGFAFPCSIASRSAGTAFAVASLTAKAALAGAWGTAAGTRSRSFSPSLCGTQKRCCSAIAMCGGISRHLYRLSPCWSFSVHSSGSHRLGHARGDNAGLLLVSPDSPRAFLIANNSHRKLVAGAIPLRWRVANTSTAERGRPSTFVPTP